MTELRGFLYTLEALAAFLSLAAVLAVLQAPPDDYSGVVVYKQASDLANELARTKGFDNAAEMARQLGLSVRVTACGDVIVDERPTTPEVVVRTLYYDGGYCELVVEASRQ